MRSSVLPGYQISESQRGPIELQIQPNTKVMQRDFSGQSGVETIERMRTFTIEAEDVQQSIIDCFDNLPKTGEPAAPAS